MKGKNKSKLFILIKKLLVVVVFSAVLVRVFNFIDFDSIIKENQGENLYIGENYRDLANIYSNNAILVDRKTGEILGGKNYKDRVHPASMTKVMTAIVALENSVDLDKKVIITPEIIEYSRLNGMSVSGFEVGDKPRIIDLIYGAILESGGEASLVLAREIGGSEGNFAQLMNEKARDLGMDNSNFSNSTGITDQENYSTTEDIAKLFNYALNNKRFKKIVTSKNYDVKGFKGPFSKRKLTNKVMITRDILNIDKSYLIGGKTGYTQLAGLCLVSFGNFDNKEYIVVTAKADGDPTSTQYNFIDLKNIYDNYLED